ncbi:ATP-binding protein [Rubrivirga sp. IMCC43871]|uniref:hybrid sensor histidine kinase/response regulator n=1 Tax=Rubrivirga sp. IMCC43871 TaxID=3391575 RepID=UPI00398FB3A0
MAVPSPLPLVTPEILTALVSPSGERLDCNEAWREVFGDDGVWGKLPVEDARFAQEYAVDAARGSTVTHQVFLLDGDDGPTPVLLHFHPIRLPHLDSGHYPISVLGEVLREPASWAAEQTRRRRMEMLGRMAMGIAHDFNNLLTSVLGHAELLRSDLARLGSDSGSRDHLVSLERAANDGAALVRKIQQYIRNEKQERAEPVSLHEIAEEVLTLTRPYWHNEPRRRGIAIRVETDLRPVPTIPGAPTELREVLVNLVLNAVQAMPAGGTLTLATERSNGTAVVSVGDTGVGMPDSVRRRIFEPLFTTKGSGGTGMGLTMSQGIVQEHNGRIEVESAPGRGTLFRLVFPFTAHEPAPEAAPQAAPQAKGAGLRLLVVDDEPMVRTVTAKLLRLRGHTVREADGGPSALAELAKDADLDAVVTDLSMPDMSGRELAAAIRQRHPGLPVLLLTGDTDAEADGADVAAVVKKPFQLDALDAAVRALRS